MILPIDKDDIGRRARKRLGGFETGKAAADDHDFRTVLSGTAILLENQGPPV